SPRPCGRPLSRAFVDHKAFHSHPSRVQASPPPRPSPSLASPHSAVPAAAPHVHRPQFGHPTFHAAFPDPCSASSRLLFACVPHASLAAARAACPAAAPFCLEVETL